MEFLIRHQIIGVFTKIFILTLILVSSIESSPRVLTQLRMKIVFFSCSGKICTRLSRFNSCVRFDSQYVKSQHQRFFHRKRRYNESLLNHIDRTSMLASITKIYDGNQVSIKYLKHNLPQNLNYNC